MTSRALFLFIALLFMVAPAYSQVRAPDDEYLFQEDSDEQAKQLEKRREKLMESPPSPSGEIDFAAPTVDFDQNENVVSGKGGVLISGEGFRLQGESGSVDLDSKDVQLEENVVITGNDTFISADEIEFNLETEAGEFKNSTFTLEEGAYQFDSERAKKLNDTEFEMEDCFLSTCHCPDGDAPWQLSGTRVHAEKEGYAHAYNSVFRFQDVPILYTPWVAFPIKQERSSGLLVPEFGYSSEDGVNVKLPLYAVIDGSTDMTFTPFTETKTRHGLEVDYREAYSERSQIDSKVIYSDERPRDGDLRGTDITNIAEPEIDDDRFGVYAKQNWRNSSASDVPLSMVSDIHWVSDTLFLREIEESDIGLSSSRYATSRMALRGQFGDFVSSSLVGEWNESLISPQDTTLQRLPEFNMTASRSYRPFGFNPYGLKVRPKLDFKVTQFQRDRGYDGLRGDLSPSMKIPFHYKNYFNSDLSLEYHQTMYSLDETSSVDGNSELDDTTNRGLARFNYQIRTAIERIFDLPEENLLTTLTSLGSRNQTHKLRRVKNTIEPQVGFSYVPGTSQSDLPLFDSFDRIRQRSLITYEVATRLIGSFDYLQGANNDFEEFLSEPDEFGTLDTLSPLTDFDAGSSLSADNFGVPLVPPTRGGKQNRELGSFRLVQSYDYVEDHHDLDPDRRAFSDVGAQLYLTPTQDFGFGAATNYDAPEQDVSSWSLASHFYDDRGDSIRARYTYVDQSISQIEGNLEVVLSPRLKLGYYARFDDQESEFIEQQAAFRLSSACDCWHIDVGFTDEINPDREKVLFRFTLRGLGDLTQNFGFNEREDNQSLQ